MISGDGSRAGRPLGHRGVELVVGHDLVDDPEALGLPRVDSLAEQQELVGLLARDVAVDERHDHERERADADLRRPEARALGGDDEVAGERDAERARQDVAAGLGERGLAELADQAEKGARTVGGLVAVHERRVGREPAEVRRPLENVRSCEEASTTQRTPSSSRARSNASMSSPRSSADSALRVSGSSRVIVATRSAVA